MKFALKLDANRNGDWPYIDYKGLKKILKELKAANKMSKTSPLDSPSLHALKMLKRPLLNSSQSCADEKNVFLTKLREQSDRIQSFYAAEVDRSQVSLDALLVQLAEGDRSLSLRTQASLVKASTDLYRTLQQLRNYTILNYTGLLKLAKKFDKKVGGKADEASGSANGSGSWSSIPANHTPRLLEEWTEELSTSPYVAAEAIEELCAQLEGAFARCFCDGSMQMARATLLVRKERPNSSLLLSLGVRGGVLLTLGLWQLWDLLVDVRIMELDPRHKEADNRAWYENELPLIRASGAVVLLQGLWAICLHVWNRARINYEFMLDFSARANTSSVVAFSIAARNGIIYLLLLLLYTKVTPPRPPIHGAGARSNATMQTTAPSAGTAPAHTPPCPNVTAQTPPAPHLARIDRHASHQGLIGELPRTIAPEIFPVAMCVLSFGSLMMPLHNGRALCSELWKIMFAPLYPVDFGSVLVRRRQPLTAPSCAPA